MNEYEKYKSQYDASRGKEKEQLLAPLQREIESLRSQSDYTVDVERGRLIDKSGVEWFIIPNTLNITVDEFFEYGKPEWVAQMQAKIESLRAELEYAKREAIRWNDEAVKIKRERDEARKEREYWRDQHRNEESLADSLREERDEARQESRRHEVLFRKQKRETEKAAKRLQKAEQANAALLTEAKRLMNRFLECGDHRAAGALEKMLAQYDTAQPTAQGEDKPE